MCALLLKLTAMPTEVREPQDCTVGRLQRGRYARIDIADSGPGMSTEQVERIFDPFFTTKPLGTGTGLGLSLVHGIVLDHGAALDVRSELRGGSTFSVYVPLTDQAPAQEPAPRALPAGNGEVVLIVDDEEGLVHLAEEVLASLGYEPVGCVGAAQALRVFRATPARFDVRIDRCDHAADVRYRTHQGVEDAAAGTAGSPHEWLWGSGSAG